MDFQPQLAIAAFLAGCLTILAPCVIPVLPIIIGGSGVDVKDKRKPYIITASLIASIFIFTILLRTTTAFIEVPSQLWEYISGGILISFGLFGLWPQAWDKVSIWLGLSTKSNQLLAASAKKHGFYGDVLIGASLGPVFASCSPTFAAIIGIALSGNTITSIIYLSLYSLGLGVVMLAVAVLGQKAIKRLGWATNPHGWLKRTIYLLFILVGLMVIAGFDKTVTTWILDGGFYDWIIQLESHLNGGVDQA